MVVWLLPIPSHTSTEQLVLQAVTSYKFSSARSANNILNCLCLLISTIIIITPSLKTTKPGAHFAFHYKNTCSTSFVASLRKAFDIPASCKKACEFVASCLLPVVRKLITLLLTVRKLFFCGIAVKESLLLHC